MALVDGKRYNAEVISAEFIAAQSGNPGLQLFLETDDGDPCDTVIWMTPKAAANARKTLTEVLGVSSSDLDDEGFVANRLCPSLAGARLSFVARAEEYNGKTKVKVGFLNKESIVGDTPLGMVAARMLGARPKSEAPGDDEVPF